MQLSVQILLARHAWNVLEIPAVRGRDHSQTVSCRKFNHLSVLDVKITSCCNSTIVQRFIKVLQAEGLFAEDQLGEVNKFPRLNPWENKKPTVQHYSRVPKSWRIGIKHCTLKAFKASAWGMHCSGRSMAYSSGSLLINVVWHWHGMLKCHVANKGYHRITENTEVDSEVVQATWNFTQCVLHRVILKPRQPGRKNSTKRILHPQRKTSWRRFGNVPTRSVKIMFQFADRCKNEYEWRVLKSGHFSSIPKNGVGQVPQVSWINTQCCRDKSDVNFAHVSLHRTSKKKTFCHAVVAFGFARTFELA